MHHRIVVLGSTGSIGRAALDVVAALGNVQVVGLAAQRSWELLARQAERFKVSRIAIADESAFDNLRANCPRGTDISAGAGALVELVEKSDADFVLAGIVGAAGLPATLAAVERGIDVGLANKESLVVAGSILVPLARQRGCRLLPVDSEHSAIFQALMCGQPQEVSKIYLTASGGPFRCWPAEKIANATLSQALQHPTWSMGPKITIDSATMMNKALEVVEAHHLFSLDPRQIEVLIHPESIVHSMVEYCDGSTIAQLGSPDMRTPIQYAITFPQRGPVAAQPLDWGRIRALHFEPPDAARFPGLRLGFEAARRGGSSGAVLNAANETAVDGFRTGRIRFGQIAELAAGVMEKHQTIQQPSVSQLLECDTWARQEVTACITR